MSQFRKLDAIQTYLIMRALAAFSFGVTFGINMVYQVAMVGLNPLQLVLVGTALELAVFVFEIPTGVLANVYSRRLSVIIGYLIIGIGFLVEAIPTFPMVLLAQIIWGLGYTFISGAADAWIVDEAGNTRAKTAFIQAERIGIVTGFLALWISIGLGLIQLNAPHIVGAITMFILSVTLLFIMPEDNFTGVPQEERNSWRDLFSTLGDGLQLIRTRRVLAMIIGTSLLLGLFSEGWDRLQTAHLLTNFGLPDPNTSFGTLILFGVIGSVGSVLAYAGNWWLERQQLQSHRALSTSLIVIYAVMGAAVLVFAWSGQLITALAALWIMGAARSMSAPIFNAWINNHISSRVRATVLSVSGQANAIGQIVGGPPVGYIGIISGIRVAISVSGAIILSTIGLVGWIRIADQPVEREPLA